jgi:hypothetical protein
MKQAMTLALGALLLLVGAGVSAQGRTVVLQNPESLTLHYLLDPQALAGFDPGSSVFPNVVYDFFTADVAADEAPTVFAELGPGQTRRLEELSEGPHLLVGFFAVAGQREFPVRVVTLQAGGALSERYYAVYSEPALVRVRAGRGRLAGYSPVSAGAGGTSAQAGGTSAQAGTGLRGGMFRFQIDNQYDDWEAIPPLLVYPGGYAPESFTRERYGGASEVLPIASARHWDRGGTSLSELKIVNDAQGIYLYAAARTAIDPNLSIFFYFQGEEEAGREGAPNQLTLELVPSHGEEPGLVVLWERGQRPAIVGELASGNFFLEARVDKMRLQRALLAADPEVSFFDLTTAFFDRGALAYEEYYYSSVVLQEIPTLDTLYSTPRP